MEKLHSDLLRANETQWEPPNDYIEYNDDNFPRKYQTNKVGKQIFKRDIEEKENDPWSMISPVGKYQNNVGCFCCSNPAFP